MSQADPHSDHPMVTDNAVLEASSTSSAVPPVPQTATTEDQSTSIMSTTEAEQPEPVASTSGTSGTAADTTHGSTSAASIAASASSSTDPSSGSTSAKPAREVKVWKPVAPGTMPKPPELPESYYNPTPGQLRAAYAGQSSHLKKLGVDTNFSSRAQREKEEREREQKRINRWPKTIVRIRFHDRHQIETTFLSSQTMDAVYAWVKSILNDETKKEPFILYVPPRIEYKQNDPKVTGKTLLELQMAPSSVFLVRWQNTDLNDANKVAPIRSDLLAAAEELPKPPSFDPTPEQLAAEEKQKREAVQADDDKDSNGKGKILGGAKAPKWLKGIGGKK